MASIDEIRNVVAEVLEAEPSQLSLDTDLYSFPAFDSVQILSLLVALSDIGVNVEQSEISDVSTFGDLLRVSGIES
ncbi:acyl carrier protein [Verrucomicrobia bacterium]|nr:acyl carrier protein [Verrucomicrobiota bacterium]